MGAKTSFTAWKGVFVAIALLGVGLVAYMVVVEGEPGALPLGLVLLGAIGYGAVVVKSRRA